jgi:hypothetical protein
VIVKRRRLKMAKAKNEKYLVRKPIYEGGKTGQVSGWQNPPMTYMCNDLVAGCNSYVSISWIWDVPNPNPVTLEHAHEYDEIVIHIGTDPKNPEDLGGEIEFAVGGEPLTFSTTTALFVPRGLKHGPITWKKCNRPHLQIAMVMGGGTLKESAPGGRGNNR